MVGIVALAAVLGTVGGIMPISKELEIRAPAEFSKVVTRRSRLVKLAGGFQFIEGPVWFSKGSFLVFSDIPAGELKRWKAGEGVSTFRRPSFNANGNTLDRQGRLVTCEHGSRTVTRTESDGSVVTLAYQYQGKRLNSPNDVVVSLDGAIWFTDPPYGIDAKTQKEQAGNYVFRLNPRTRELKVVADDFDRPNGLCFSPDEKRLYIGDSGKPHHIRVFDVQPDGTLAGGRLFCTIDRGVPDGIRCDAEGRVYSSAGDGVQIFLPDGTLIGKILTPETPANLTFGGADRRTLFITAQKSLYSIRVAVKGAQRP